MSRIRIILAIAIAAVAIALPARAQAAAPLSVTPSTTTIKAGGSVTITISAPTAISGLSAIQWNATITGTTPAATIGAYTISSVDSAASKLLQCNTTACVAYGNNQNTIPAGPIATVVLNAPPGLTSGTITFTVTAVQGSSITGQVIAFTAAGPLAIPIQSLFDLNGDGVVNSADLAIELTAVLQGILSNNPGTPAAPCAFDVNGDGACNVQDVQLVRNQYP